MLFQVQSINLTGCVPSSRLALSPPLSFIYVVPSVVHPAACCCLLPGSSLWIQNDPLFSSFIQLYLDPLLRHCSQWTLPERILDPVLFHPFCWLCLSFCPTDVEKVSATSMPSFRRPAKPPIFLLALERRWQLRKRPYNLSKQTQDPKVDDHKGRVRVEVSC